MNTQKHIFFSVLILLLSLVSQAQLKSANKLFEQYKYYQAIPHFLKVAERKQDSIPQQVVVRLAESYRLTQQFGKAAIWYKQGLKYENLPPYFYMNYGQVLRTLERYSKAQAIFELYDKSCFDNEKSEPFAAYCEIIETWKNLPASAKVENDSILNTRFSEFSPVTYKDGLVFVSDRDMDLIDDNNFQWTGKGYLNLYSITHENYAKKEMPEKMSRQFNQDFHDGPVCFFNEEKEMITTRTFQHKWKKKYRLQVHHTALYFAKLQAKKVEYIPFTHNSLEFSTAHPTLSSNNETLIFSSNKNGGHGKSDLYISKKENGEWSVPQNLGDSINTNGNEYFPYLANDSTLFFASDGHMGYGGLDLFVSELKNGQWQKPVNLKAPLNSSYDDFAIIFTDEKKCGYFSSNRPGGKGFDDIYKFSNFKLIADPE